MAVGVTQPGGAGTTIFIYDDASSASGLGYTFAEISAAFPVDFVSNGTNKPSYRARVSLQVGDTGVGASTTTLVDTVESAVDWDSTRTLLYRTTQTSSWFTNLGTKVGSGNQASGHKGTTLRFGAATTIRGTFNCWGGDIRTSTGTITWLLPTGGGGEMVNTLIQSSVAAGNQISFTGSAANSFNNIFNVDVSGSTTGTLVNNWFSLVSDRLSFAGNGARLFSPPSATAVTLKDCLFKGTPTSHDIGWQAATVVSHILVRPIWTNNAPKFGFNGGTGPALGSATLEMWRYDMKVVDGLGAAVVGVPVRLTDNLSNVQVNTVTTSDGRLSFGSGLTENAVTVMDHYSDGVQYVQRHRSPFLAEINLSTMAGYNSNYASRRFFFDWPGKETVTTSSGTFEDVGDLINLSEPSGAATNWTECSLP